MPIWTIKRSDGIEQSLADWGLSKPVITRETAGQDKATFNAVVPAADAPLIFNDLDTATVYRTDPVSGVKSTWFSGVWTKTPRDIEPMNESVTYELSGGPWYYLAHCPMQTFWNVTNGSTADIAPVLKALMIIGMSPDLESVVKIDLFTYLELALQFCIDAGAAQTDLVTGAPKPIVPFQIGTISATDFIVPYEQVKNLSCAQLIQHMLKWIPDASFWVDYSTAPAPTIHVEQRRFLRSIALAMGSSYGPTVKSITPRTDLLIPGVVLQYDLTNTIDGVPETFQVIDRYPVNCNPLNFRTLVCTVDLQGGHETFQKNPITVTDRPLLWNNEVALPWVKKKLPWLFGQTGAPEGEAGGADAEAAFTYDVDHIVMGDLTTTINPSDPSQAPGGPPAPNLNALTEELLSGPIAQWMIDDQGVLAAMVIIKTTLNYNGSDPTTAALFQNNPQVPNTRVDYFAITATNAQTKTYTRLTSVQGAEPVPPGLAKNIYDSNSVLQWEGSVELTERECSGLVPLGTVLNITGSANAAWATMQAQVHTVTEDIDTGKTTVAFGPFPNLGVMDYVDLLRALRGRIPTYSLDERTSGDSTNADVKGHVHIAHSTHTTTPGTAATSKPLPWDMTFQKNPANPAQWQYKIYLNSSVLKSPSTTDNLPVTGLDVWTPITPDQTLAYLQATVTSLVSGNPTIMLTGAGGAYDRTVAAWSDRGFVENDGASNPNQTLWRIGTTLITWTAGVPSAVNLLGVNLMLRLQNFNGEAAIYPDFGQANT